MLLSSRPWGPAAGLGGRPTAPRAGFFGGTFWSVDHLSMRISLTGIENTGNSIQSPLHTGEARAGGSRWAWWTTPDHGGAGFRSRRPAPWAHGAERGRACPHHLDSHRLRATIAKAAQEAVHLVCCLPADGCELWLLLRAGCSDNR